MNNLILWIIFMLVDFCAVLIVYKIFGKTGLFSLISMSIILANIQVIKMIDLFGFTVTLGNVIYGSIFLSTDLIAEFHGKEDARKAVWIGFAVMVIATIYMQLTLLFSPAEADFISPHLEALFSFMPRVVIGSLIAYLLSQLHDVWLFTLIKKKTKGKMLWLRNNISTLTSQLIDSLVFCTIAFLGAVPTAVFFQILVSTYLIKAVIGIFDTPFMYLARMFNKKKQIS